MIKFFNKYSFQILGSFNPNMGNSKYSKKTGTHTFLQIKIKKITHMGRRWDTPQHFFSAFIDELWKTQKIRILQKGKKIAGDIIILHMCTKNDNHMRYSSWDTVQEKNFFLSFWVIFDIYPPPPPPSPPNNPENQNLEKNEKSIYRCHHCKLVQQKTQSNDACLLRYGVWQT